MSGRLLFGRVLLIIAVLMFLVSAMPAAVRAQTRADSNIYLPLIGQGFTNTKPLNVQVVLDPGHRTQNIVPPSGATLTLTGGNGTKFSLAIPDGALWVTQTITMTLVSAMPGLPLSGGIAAAVDLQPAGLQFLQPATLTIEPAAPIPADRQVFLAYDGTGQDVRLHPPIYDRSNPGRIAMLVSHFSGYGVGSGASGALQGNPPSGLMEQIASQIAALIQAERAAQLAGRPGDPEFTAKLTALTRRMYTEVVQPTLTAAQMTGCRGKAGQAAVDRAISLALGWLRNVQLMAMDASFAGESQAINDAITGAMYACWYDATTPCLDWENPSQVQRVLAIARQAQLIGLPASQFDPNSVRKCGPCEWVKAVRNWEGTVDFSYANNSTRTQYGSTITANVKRSASMRYGMATASGWGGRERWEGNATGGSGMIDDKVVDATQYGSYIDTWVGNGPLNLAGSYTSYAKMNIDAAACHYSIEFHPWVETLYTNEGVPSPLVKSSPGVPYLFELPVPANAPGRVLAGSMSLKAESKTAQNTFTHFHFTGAFNELEFALGDDLGAAPVSWRLAPAWFWDKP